MDYCKENVIREGFNDPDTGKDEVIHLMNPCDDFNMAAYRVDRDLIKIVNKPEALMQAEEFKTTLF